MMTKKKQPISMWVSLGLLLILSIFVIVVSTKMDARLTGGLAVQTVSIAPKGSTLDFEVRNVPGLSSARATFADNVKGLILRFDETKPVPFDGKEYSHFTVSSDQADKISQLDFTFKILEAELLRRGISPDDVQLYLNGHQILLTQTTKEDRYLYYTATSTELGQYVIGKATPAPLPAPSTVAQQTPPKETPVMEQTPVQTEPTPVIPTSISGKAVSLPEKKSGVWITIKAFFDGLFSRK